MLFSVYICTRLPYTSIAASMIHPNRYAVDEGIHTVLFTFSYVLFFAYDLHYIGSNYLSYEGGFNQGAFNNTTPATCLAKKL